MEKDYKKTTSSTKLLYSSLAIAILVITAIIGLTKHAQAQTERYANPYPSVTPYPYPPSGYPINYCTSVYNPVCGINGVTYTNACVAIRINNTPIAHTGACNQPHPNPYPTPYYPPYPTPYPTPFYPPYPTPYPTPYPRPTPFYPPTPLPTTQTYPYAYPTIDSNYWIGPPPISTNPYQATVVFPDLSTTTYWLGY